MDNDPLAMEAPPLERKLAAILAADVEGYSRLMHADEDATLATLSAHRTLVDDLIATGRGQISGTAGDSVLAEFASVVDAVTCAVAIQQALHKANADLSPDRQMRFRIGINVGDVVVKDGDIFGDGVNVAARLEALAEPGGVCITRGVRDHVRDRVAFGFDDLGEQAVKNIARPVRVFRLLFDPNGTTALAAEGGDAAAPAGSAVDANAAGTETAVELAFWSSIQAADDPREYRAYLERYPNGSFAGLARARLADPAPTANERAATSAAAGDQDVELAFWDTVKDSSNPAMFDAYLNRYPAGVFKTLAEIRLAELKSAEEATSPS